MPRVPMEPRIARYCLACRDFTARIRFRAHATPAIPILATRSAFWILLPLVSSEHLQTCEHAQCWIGRMKIVQHVYLALHLSRGQRIFADMGMDAAHGSEANFAGSYFTRETEGK